MQDGLETKFARLGEDLAVSEGSVIEGYASIFGLTDQGGDVVEAGGYAASPAAPAASGRRGEMLWQAAGRMGAGDGGVEDRAGGRAHRCD